MGLWDSYEKFTDKFDPKSDIPNEDIFGKILMTVGGVAGGVYGYYKNGLGGAIVGAGIGALVLMFAVGACIGLVRWVIYHLLLLAPFIIVIGAIILLWGVKF
jgi:hypothetical protein